MVIGTKVYQSQELLLISVACHSHRVSENVKGECGCVDPKWSYWLYLYPSKADNFILYFVRGLQDLLSLLHGALWIAYSSQLYYFRYFFRRILSTPFKIIFYLLTANSWQPLLGLCFLYYEWIQWSYLTAIR